MGEKQFLSLSLKKIWKFEFFDLFAQLAELEFRKYIPSFPYGHSEKLMNSYLSVIQ